MAAGDAQRVWFAEMLEELRGFISPDVQWAELSEFCSMITAKRKALRESRGIRPPLMRCPKCGTESRSDIKGVSIRSALFAARNNGYISDSEFKVMDRTWGKHRKAHDLDPYGCPNQDAKPQAQGGHCK